MSTYLLAKSRVSKVPANERNYHIFYWLCLEATPEERENLYINNMEHYRFLDSDCTLSMPSNFERVRKAMDVINLSKEVDQIDVFKTLSIILTLGNLEFTTGLRKRDFEDNATIISRSSKIGSTSETSLSVREKADSLDVLHQLLKFESPESQNTFELALTSKKICDTRCNLPIHQAKQNVNALARHLYQKLFNYLVSQINIMLDDHDMLHDQSMNDEAQQTQTKEITENFISDNTKVITSSKHDEAYVGVLDIFGFEDMLPYSCNGFEQLCINYANEQLHTFFLDQLIVNDLKQKVYLAATLYTIVCPMDYQEYFNFWMKLL
ncbi:uncharacterized protein LOC128884054 [Hylaeus volcanicus]|uniref:uncharacterized protein LOC128884054 n=1 Tax=Hylaeus volcanicus TaxID=313075 RepID=UPI0023B80061|nr:uncharacterized protein LOC128884054 [Hylaeus volcanicus]